MTNTSPTDVTIFEVGPRDGLQNEKKIVPTADKVRLIDMLSAAGFAKIEATSFVSPKWVPQMADAADVMAGIVRRAGTTYAVLTPNLRGYEGARTSDAGEVAIFAAASEAFSKKNINCTIAESLERFEPVLTAAAEDGTPVRGYISCVVGCPYDGAVAPDAVRDIATWMIDKGCYEVSLGDTIGIGTKETISALLDAVTESVPAARLAGHYHDTGGKALECIEASLAYGVRTFDSSIAGLGGCPYAPGASGNVATSSVASFLAEAGFETGLDTEKLADAARFASTLRT